LVYDTTFQYARDIGDVKLVDLVKLNLEPFSIEIHEYQNEDKVYYSTKDQFLFFEDNLTHVGATLSVNKQRVFGLGERIGNFFIPDKTRISLWNNDQNYTTTNSSTVKTIHCKNGFFPTYFYQIAGSSNLASVTKFNAEGQDFTFFQDADNSKANVHNVYSGKNFQ